MALLVALGSVPCLAQGVAPAFEVASVRHNTSGDSRAFWSPGLMPNLWGEVTPGRDRVYITNAPLRDIIARAHGVNIFLDRFMLTGGPGNILSARFDITATPPGDAAPGQTLVMLQTLLAERFHLKIHAESRQTPIYAITVMREERLGPQLRRSAHDCLAFFKARAASSRDGQENTAIEEPRDVSGRSLCRRNYEFNTPGPGALTIRYASPLGFLASRVQPDLDRPVVDATGLTGSFEWALSYSPRTDSFDSAAPSIFTAFQEQLGLRLERRSGPVEVLVIDSVEMPTPN